MHKVLTVAEHNFCITWSNCENKCYDALVERY